MSERPQENLDDGKMAGRAAELAQFFLDGTLTEQEATELLAIWECRPDLEANSKANYYTEQVFLLIEHAKAFISPMMLQQMKKAALERFSVPNSDAPDSDTMNRQLQGPFSHDSLDLDDLVRLAVESPALPQEKRDERKTSSPERRGRMGSKFESLKIPTWFRWLTVPCLLLFGLLIFNEFKGKPESQQAMTAAARIIESVEAEWEDEQFKVGREMDPGRMKLKSGLVKVEFADGAVVLLEGPTELLIQDKNKAFCPDGKLSVTVPKQAIGFEIGTPFASVVDLGTAFAVEVTSVKAEVHVITGKVEIRKSKLEIIPLPEGLAMSIDVRGEKKDFQADPKVFCTEDRFQDRQAAYVAKRREIWDRQAERLDRDPSLVYQLRPEEQRRLDLVDGSRPDRKALRLQSPKHFVDVPAIDECQSLTLRAKVRIGRQLNLCNTLLIGERLYSEKGKFLWQLTQDGMLQFHVNTDSTGANGQVTRFDTAPFIAQKDRGTWVSLALVADSDAKAIRHYIDGELVETLSWPEPMTLRLDGMILGNERPGARRPVTRFWSGDIEELLIFNRALSDEEIDEYYRNDN